MDTKDFRTRTIISKQKNPSKPDKWGIAVDIGYSGTKIYSPNVAACFPSFAARIEGAYMRVPNPSPDTILYRDRETGRMWQVGRAAQNAVSVRDADSNSMSIYGRTRYFDPMFLVVARAAIGIACSENEFGGPNGRKIVLQTGLPNSYLKSDRPLIKEVLAGRHAFDLRIGPDEWKSFDITLDASDISVIQQPLGTLLSISMGENGVLTPEYERYYNSNILICDPGFGTMDCFTLSSGIIRSDDVQTLGAFTMKEVLKRTSDEIFKKYGTEIPVPSMQKYLEQGTFVRYDRKAKKGENIPFGEILEEKCREVAMEAVDRLCEMYADLLDYEYLILTGGTGEAWFPYFKEALGGLPNLSIVPGNQNAGTLSDKEPVPFIFSNVRGYYFYVQR